MKWYHWSLIAAGLMLLLFFNLIVFWAFEWGLNRPSTWGLDFNDAELVRARDLKPELWIRIAAINAIIGFFVAGIAGIAGMANEDMNPY
jgi:hypothetical protein